MMKIIEGRWMGLVLLVLGAVGVVHAAPALEKAAGNDAAAVQSAKPKVRKPPTETRTLPIPVEEMRQAILAAAQSGNIEDLREPLEWNELKPEVSAPAGTDPIAYWRTTSADGNGREILAVLANILPMRAAELPLGKDIENNIIYVWPYLAEADLDKLTPAQEVDLLRLMSPAEAKTMRAAKKWTWWRLTIGADGTWHSFKKSE